MSGFSADWLRQREPFDRAARAFAAARLRLPDRLTALRANAAIPWRVIDLGCGTGANVRALAPQLGATQQWLVVDNDAKLFARWPAALAENSAAGSYRVQHRGDILHVQAAGFDAAIARRALDLARDLADLPFAHATLVTASALLDLVSAEWLQHLVAACHTARVAVLFALSVDGRVVWRPADRGDARAAALFAAHQRRDKGFGPALGPRAAAVASRALRAAGYGVHRAHSDWWLDGAVDPGAMAMQRALIDGITAAAIEQAPAAAGLLSAWRARRQALADRATLRIGHVDLLATPPRASAQRARAS
jgi:SAM-dependent methyltransferase